MTEAAGLPSSRATFVTVIAWVFIALSGFATTISLMQNVMIYFMLPAEEMRSAASEAQKGQGMPFLFAFLFHNVHFIFAAFFVLCATMLASSIGLLWRKNWARWVFIAILGFGIAWNLVWMVFPFVMFPPLPEGAPDDMRREAALMMKIMLGFTVVIGVAFSVLFAWIIKRLVSRDIRREFVPPQEAV